MSLPGVRFPARGHPGEAEFWLQSVWIPSQWGTPPRGCFSEAHVAVQIKGANTTPPSTYTVLWVGRACLVLPPASAGQWLALPDGWITSGYWLVYVTQSFNTQHKHEYKRPIWCMHFPWLESILSMSPSPVSNNSDAPKGTGEQHGSSTQPAGSESARESWCGWQSQNTACVPQNIPQCKQGWRSWEGAYINTPSRDLRDRCVGRAAPQRKDSMGKYKAKSMRWFGNFPVLLGKEDHICSIFVIFPTVFKKKGWKSSIFFDPIINVQVISIPTEATGNESQLIKVRLQPGGVGGTHTQGQLRSAPPPHQPPNLILSVSVELGSPRQYATVQILKMSLHPTLHHISHLTVMACAHAQQCREGLLFLGQCRGENACHWMCSVVFARDALTWAWGTKSWTHIGSPAVASCVKLQ